MGSIQPRPQDSFRRAKINILDLDDTTAIRTLPELIEWNAKYNQDHLFCTQLLPQAQPQAQHTRIDITYGQLRQSIARVAWRLRKLIPDLHPPQVASNGDIIKAGPIVLFCESNIGLWFHLMALMGMGVPVAILSARLSPTAIHHLLSAIKAKAVVASPRLTDTIHDAIAIGLQEPCDVYIQERVQIDLEVADAETKPDESMDLQTHFVSESDRNVLILHSSGTTGLPKPIFHPHRYLLGFTQCHLLNEAEDIQGTVLSALPLFHGFGLLAPCISLGAGKPFMLPPPHRISTGQSIVDILQAYNAQALMAVPHILEEITAHCTGTQNKGIDALRPLQFVLCGGGPLREPVGEKLADSGVRLIAHFGTTECGPLAPVFVPSMEANYDWRYIRLRRDILQRYKLDQVREGECKLTMRPFGWDEPFEVQDLLISRSEKHKYDVRAAGRTDDLIVLANGEKVVPRVLESLLCENKHVKAAVAFGEGHFQIGVIVEPAQGVAMGEIEAFKLSLWPAIVEAGKRMDSHARISSLSSIIIAPTEKPLPRSDKGSVLRKETYRVFESEVQQAYRGLESGNNQHDPLDLNLYTIDQKIKDLIQEHLGWDIPSSKWSVESDLFELGMNSLQAMQLHRLLVSYFPQYRDAIPLDFVHKHPAISQLVGALRAIAGPMDQENNSQEIDDFIRAHSVSTLEQIVVLLTGSTGHLGSNLLGQLVQSPQVKRVICLKRTSSSKGPDGDSLQQQLRQASEKGVNIPSTLGLKIETIHCDPIADALGLNTETYAYLASSITHIIHNAWPMDFKRGLSSFASQFRYLNNLLKLALSARTTRPRFLFVSSIAVVGAYPSVHGMRVVPEVQASKNTIIDEFGYGRAKFVCESILDEAARMHSDKLEVAIVRVGQMSGSSTSGHWNPKEHVPTMFRFAKRISKLPVINGTLSWIPINTAAKVLGDILLSAQLSASQAQIYHLENPIRQSWSDVLDMLANGLGISSDGAERLPFDLWLSQVKESIDNDKAEPTDRVEFQMLAEFLEKDFRRMATGGIILDTQNTRAASSTLRYMEEVSPHVIRKYIAEWKRSGFLR
ncbi:uncharacterized protein DSM5745_00508 [Aspergillus mulundensis]|uniref:Carrier domain-containing protein n=1 Tax=Aspergillus mulundensis TaxID=1810919 RepID=A0A3D8T3Q7_9EURO|nr:Uncharacterized protein DSM5745_00508 [Aspergillus mulundensis]RDW93186.1 Uncharacterized protein DSM5745_00508 [Aspergillus mulundensis]